MSIWIFNHVYSTFLFIITYLTCTCLYIMLATAAYWYHFLLFFVVNNTVRITFSLFQIEDTYGMK